MNIVQILLPVVMIVFILLFFVIAILSVVRSRRQMKQTQQIFNRIWNQTAPTMQHGTTDNPMADMLNNPFQAVNRVFESVAQQIEADNRAPQVQVMARVLSRRQSFHHSSVGSHHAYSGYYVTFELDNGDRMELHLSGQEYGLLIEGDTGVLTYQGSRYVRFERNR
jgi:hypothetical protein